MCYCRWSHMWQSSCRWTLLRRRCTSYTQLRDSNCCDSFWHLLPPYSRSRCHCTLPLAHIATGHHPSEQEHTELWQRLPSLCGSISPEALGRTGRFWWGWVINTEKSMCQVSKHHILKDKNCTRGSPIRKLQVSKMVYFTNKYLSIWVHMKPMNILFLMR